MGLGGPGIACATVVMFRPLGAAIETGSPLAFSGGVRDPATKCEGSGKQNDSSKQSQCIADIC